MPQGRVKLSISLPSDLVARIDRLARDESRPRSRILERWLRRAAEESAQLEVEASTIAYYESLFTAEKREEAAMAAAMSRAGRRLEIDGAAAPAKRRPRR